MVDKWIQAEDDFDKLAAPALNAVEEQFRSLLGVTRAVFALPQAPEGEILALLDRYAPLVGLQR